MFTKMNLSFQCHQDLEIELAPITVLTGENDRGKSAVMRALRWLALNQWDDKADSFIPWGMGHAEVTLAGEAFQINRTKGKGVNGYTLNELVFPSLAAGKVPAEVAKVLKLGEANFQTQDEAAFWLSLTPGQAAAELNEIFNLSQIDEATLVVGKELREARAETKVVEERLARLQREKEQSEWVKRADPVLREAEQVWKALKEAEENLAEIETLTLEIQGYAAIEKSLDAAIRAGEAATRKGQEVLARTQKLSYLKCLIEEEDKICRLERSLAVKEKQLKAWLVVCPLCGQTTSA